MKVTCAHFLVLMNKFVEITLGITGKRFLCITHSDLLQLGTQMMPSVHLTLRWRDHFA